MAPETACASCVSPHQEREGQREAMRLSSLWHRPCFPPPRPPPPLPPHHTHTTSRHALCVAPITYRAAFGAPGQAGRPGRRPPRWPDAARRCSRQPRPGLPPRARGHSSSSSRDARHGRRDTRDRSVVAGLRSACNELITSPRKPGEVAWQNRPYPKKFPKEEATDDDALGDQRYLSVI